LICPFGKNLYCKKNIKLFGSVEYNIMNKENKFIFSINTGRAGSEYLALLLSMTQECQSFHEAYPNFAGDPIRKFNTLGPENTLDLQRIKINQILNDCSSGKPIYADTSHVFIKSWYYAAVKDLRNISVIWLRRNSQETINSLLRLNTIPDKSLSARNWYLRTDYPFNLTAPPKNRTNKALCEWYVEEIETRAQKFHQTYPHIPFYEVWLHDLNSEENVLNLLRGLHLTPLLEIKKIIGAKKNLKTEARLTIYEKIKRHLRIGLIRLNFLKSKDRLHIKGDGLYS